MKTYITFLFLLVLSIACNAQKIDGSWKATMVGPNGDMNLTYTFKVEADSILTGNVSSEMGSLPLENGKVHGKEISFTINVNGQEFTNNGVLDGDVIKISLPMMEKPMELKRATDKSKIDGVWKGKASSPQGEFELTFTFKVDGNTLTGKNSSAMGEADLSNGIVNGNEFSFDVEFNGMKIAHKCKYLDDDTIDVKVNVMDQDMAMKLTRADK